MPGKALNRRCLPGRRSRSATEVGGCAGYVWKRTRCRGVMCWHAPGDRLSLMDRIYYQEKRPEMLAFVPDRRATVLEIGCGDGLFAASIPETKEVWGIEPNKTAAEAASSRLYKVIDSTFEDASPSLPTRYFDLVIANDVIEHMADHDAFFIAIKRYIAHGGVLLGSIPNVRH